MTEKQYTRSVAIRLFSDELAEAIVLPREDEEYAISYVQLPTGHKVNRVFIAGVLVEKDDIGSDVPFYKLRISDKTSTFDANIGQYSPDQAQLAIEDIEPPAYISVVGKIKSREYKEKVYHSIAVESINTIEESTYNHWIDETTKQTADRISEHNNEVI